MKSLILFSITFFGLMAHATCYQQVLKRGQYQNNIKGQNVDLLIQWDGLIKNFGAIAVGDEEPLVADFSCSFEKESNAANNLDMRKCTINEGNGTFYTTMGKEANGAVDIKSMIVNGKFAGVRSSDPRNREDLDLGIRGSANQLIDLKVTDDATCNEFFNAPIVK